MKTIVGILFFVALWSVTKVMGQDYPQNWSGYDISIANQYLNQEQKNYILNLDIVEAMNPTSYYLAGNSEKRFYWSSFVRQTLASVIAEPTCYSHWDRDSQIAIAWAYGLSIDGNIGSDLSNGYSYSKNPELQNKLRDHLNSKEFVSTQIDRLMPAIKGLWKLMPSDLKKIYTDMLLHAEKYVLNYSHKQEKKKLKKKPEDFTYEEGNPYRKMETFFYRRFQATREGKGNWSTEFTLQIIQQLKKNLSIK